MDAESAGDLADRLDGRIDAARLDPRDIRTVRALAAFGETHRKLDLRPAFRTPKGADVGSEGGEIG